MRRRPKGAGRPRKSHRRTKRRIDREYYRRKKAKALERKLEASRLKWVMGIEPEEGQPIYTYYMYNHVIRMRIRRDLGLG